MRVGLMVPCYIDMFYPQVGVATLELHVRCSAIRGLGEQAMSERNHGYH